MQKFVLNIIILAMIILMGYVGIAYCVNQPQRKGNDFLAGMIDKHQRIQAIEEDKVILVGGSNLAFGIDSKRLQDAWDVPVFNLGLHAGLGLELMLAEAKTFAKEGDIVLLSIEHFLDVGSYRLKKYLTRLYPEASKFYTKNAILEISIHIEETRKNLKRVIEGEEYYESVYSRDGFNKYGDLVGHIDADIPEKLTIGTWNGYRYWEGIAALNDFYAYAQSKKIDVFFIYPTFCETEYNNRKEAIEHLHKDMQEGLAIEILNEPQDLVYADSLFFDTEYHLNKNGRILRTQKIIELTAKNANYQKALAARRNQ